MTVDIERYQPRTEISAGEWESLERRVSVLAKSALVPEHFRNKPADLMVAALGLRDLGVNPTLPSISQCYVVKGRPGYMAQIQIALAARHGWDIRPGQVDEKSAAVRIRRMDSAEDFETVTFTMAEAERGGLPARNDNYKKFPDRMLFARAATKAISQYCPQVMLGMAGSVDLDELEQPPPPAFPQPPKTATPEAVGTTPEEEATPADSLARRAYYHRFHRVPPEHRPAVIAALHHYEIPAPADPRLTEGQAIRALTVVEIAEQEAEEAAPSVPEAPTEEEYPPGEEPFE